MPPTTIHTPPDLDAFIPLAEHQSQTPESFYGARPVLHYHAVGLRAVASSSNASKLPIFPPTAASLITTPAEEAERADPENVDDQNCAILTEEVDAYICSELVYLLQATLCLAESTSNLIVSTTVTNPAFRYLTLFNPTKSIGVSIPYPTISLHAIQTSGDPADSSRQVQGLYMQLELSDQPDADDDDLDFVEVTLFPHTSLPEDSVTADIQAMFEAVASCSNLHPNPSYAEEEMMDDGNDRIMFEGNVGYEGISGGWITAENVAQYFDDDGNWIGGSNGESLGEGAGRVRTRDEAEHEDVNGHDQEETDEHKRPRAE
jgi:chloride channel, nucleotide-sensitive, 1A